MIDKLRRTILVPAGVMNPQMKQNIRLKIEGYGKRAKELSDIMKYGAPKENKKVDRVQKSCTTDDNRDRSSQIDYIQVQFHRSRFL